MNLKDLLSLEFNERSKRNPAYSLRAFAKQLGVDSSYLSKILTGKRKLSKRAELGFAKKLNWDPEKLKSLSKSEFQQIEMDQFKIISDWYHFAILELVHTESFRPSSTWIARSLKISFGEAQDAVERLKRLNMIQVDAKGSWKVTVQNSTTHHAQTNEALQKMQTQILTQAIQALTETPLTERDQSTVTMCVSEARLEQAKLMIKNFRRDLMHFLEGGKTKDRVYQLNVSLFPVSQKAEKSI
ncbi:MAG: TIGR02147 family protein [Bdellovibrionia bacterium]